MPTMVRCGVLTEGSKDALINMLPPLPETEICEHEFLQRSWGDSDTLSGVSCRHAQLKVPGSWSWRMDVHIFATAEFQSRKHDCENNKANYPGHDLEQILYVVRSGLSLLAGCPVLYTSRGLT
jgi:hypothetical protein